MSSSKKTTTKKQPVQPTPTKKTTQIKTPKVTINSELVTMVRSLVTDHYKTPFFLSDSLHIDPPTVERLFNGDSSSVSEKISHTIKTHYREVYEGFDIQPSVDFFSSVLRQSMLSSIGSASDAINNISNADLQFKYTKRKIDFQTVFETFQKSCTDLTTFLTQK